VTSPSGHNPCATCGICCRAYVVPCYGYDVWRLATRQRLSPDEFIVLVPEKKPRPEGFRLRADGQVYTLALDKKGPFGIKRPCVFLIELPGGNDRCGVYSERPVVCQTYPMSMWSKVVVQRTETLCPPDSWPMTEVQRPHWRTKLTLLCFHLDIYGEVVSRWNARVAAYPQADFVLMEYLSYLQNVYDKLHALGEALGPEVMEVVEASWPTFPRPALDEETVTKFADSVPWLGYFARARRVIDSFYKEIPSQPPSMRATGEATASELPAAPPEANPAL
jgi:Fe-S-cluster containining protein